MPPSRRTRTALRGCGVAFAAVLVLGSAAACTAHDSTGTAGAPPSGPAVAGSTTGPGATSPATPPSAGSGAVSTTPAGTAGGASGSATSASETLPDAAARKPGPAGLAPAAAPGPSLTGPLPATAAASGVLVAGFPKDVVPVLAGVDVVSSSVSSSGTRLQVGLEGSSGAAPTDVTGAYVAALGGAGFAVGDSPAIAGSTATAFTRGPDGLVLTVRDRAGGGTDLTVAGTLTTAG
ncbi:hypothetical protein ACPPVS_03035 [Cellulomonas sp. McL0617]|uniref:hypothetical protein n=1 Tax=Cellulomonas sp. McL0617 TaxID=3415675 RepID=UPI003CF6B5D4